MQQDETDPARELTELARNFASNPSKNPTTVTLAKILGVDVASPIFLEILAAIQRRIADLERLVDDADDPYLDAEHRAQVKSATGAFRNFLHPNRGHQAWADGVARFLTAEHIQALRFFGSTARRYRPLRSIPDQERDHAVDRVYNAIAAVKADKELEAWAQLGLVSSLERLAVTLKYLKFFGHEAVIAELLLAHGKISVVERQTSRTASIYAALTAINLACSLFVAPDRVLAAFDRYKAWPSSVVEYVIQNTPKDTKLLSPPPAARRPEEPGEETRPVGQTE